MPFNAKAVAGKGLMMVFVFPVYWQIISEGLRTLLPPLAMRIYKLPLPFVRHLGDFEGFYKLDLANIFSVLLLFTVWYFWVQAIKVLLAPDILAHEHPTWKPEAHQTFVLTVGGLVLLGDAILFFCGLRNQGSFWDGDTAPLLPCLLATAVYMVAIVGVSYVSFKLKYS